MPTTGLSFCRMTRWAVAILAGIVLANLAVPARAQRDLPPEKGGVTYSLGMPPVYKGRAGFELMWYRPQNDNDVAGLFSAGISRDLGSPVVGIAGLRLEGYLGFRKDDLEGGGRALFEIPSFHFGLGMDYNGTDAAWDLLYALDLPVRRGGLFGRGTTLALRWLPTRDQTFSAGVNVPLWGRNIGKTRPRADNTRLDARSPERLAIEVRDQRLTAALADLRERAAWVARLTQPFAEPEGADPRQAMAPVVAELQEHMARIDAAFPDGHTLPAEIRAYHQTLDLAFSLAQGADASSPWGRRAAAKARDVLLDEVLVPYNYRLGQRKKNDSVIGMVAIANTEFGSWLLSESEINAEHVRPTYFVFQSLCDIVEENRRELRDRWGDSRFVWLPLQYALKPEEHDSQAELDALIARATQQPMTAENRVFYIVNEQFQWEMARSVRVAEDYHVLWIHDYRGYNGQGQPDAIAYAQTLNYLEALSERVESYDATSRLPQYFILLDQHYFEINKARLWLRLLSDPLNYRLRLPDGFEAWEQRLEATQDRLRQAVAASRLLQIGRSQYGDKWLRNRIKVQVNITNPADPSFWSWHVAGIIPIPDNMMRDHRKIAFYDITEDDPYRGYAMFTGMGIGEHYVGANWEDRAIMLQGPGALAVKDAARDLLEDQGYEPEEIPFPLRARTKPRSYVDRLAAEHGARTPDWMESRGQVLQLHNETGFDNKPVNVAKAIQFSLMPPGSVLKVPDSLWQSYVYGSLLAGSSLRGCKSLVIAPTTDSAPSGAAPTLARAHGLLGRLIVFSEAMAPHIASAGGLLKVGLYNPRQGVGDIAGRFRQAVDNSPAWVRQVYPENVPANSVAGNVAAILDSLGYTVDYLGEDAEFIQPKIHLKANFFASDTAWRKLLARPELAAVLREYIAYLASQGQDEAGEVSDITEDPVRLIDRWLILVENLLAELTPAEKEDLIYYFAVGSTNMDYRSMVMDGEVMILVGGWQALYGVLDFILLPGLCDWVDTPEELDRLLAPPGGLTRWLAGLMKLSL